LLVIIEWSGCTDFLSLGVPPKPRQAKKMKVTDHRITVVDQDLVCPPTPKSQDSFSYNGDTSDTLPPDTGMPTTPNGKKKGRLYPMVCYVYSCFRL
jgi:hypothetical protein